MASSRYNTFPESDDSGKDTPGWAILWTSRAVTCVSPLGEGYDLSVIAGVLVLIKQEFALNSLEVALLVGLFGFSCALGALIGGPLSDAFGRKFGLLTTYLLLACGVCIMVMAPNPFVLILGRCLQGCSIGSAFVTVGAYMSELAPAKSRGLFVGLEAVFFNVGVLLGSAANYFLLGVTGSSSSDWRLMIGLAAVFPICCFFGVLSPFCPESPRWLYLQGRTEEALKIIRQTLSSLEAKAIEDRWRGSVQDDAAATATWSQVLCPSNSVDRRNLVQGVGVIVVQMATGIQSLISYSGTILAKDLSEKQAFLGLMCTATGKLGVLCFVVFLIDSVGRRPMLVLSTGLMSVGYFVLGWCFLVNEDAWTKVFAMAMVMGFFSLGLGSAAYVFVSEIFSNKHRGKGSAVAFVLSRCVAGTYGFLFPFVVEEYSTATAFFLFGGACFIGFLFILCCVQETKGMLLETIND